MSKYFFELMSSDPKLLNSHQTIRAVICYLTDGDRYLLLLKAKGKFGGGFWNAPGGKIEPGETPEQATKREVFEETGMTVRTLERMGSLIFYFGSGKPRPDWTAEVFMSRDFTGTIKESKEGKLKWFRKDEIPYDHMWEDDRHWLPLLMNGVKFSGTFEFTADSKKLVSFNIV